MTDMPEFGGRKSAQMRVEAAKTYWWCACGRSKTQPFCDGSHKVTLFTPIEFQAEKSEDVWFCTCKRTNKKPFCDGSHKKYAMG
jgi:CDGSH-type Zn-finger protein